MILGLAILAGCRTNSPMGLMELREGGRLYTSDPMIAYIQSHVTLNIRIGPNESLDVLVANRGSQTVAIDPNNFLWVLHCDNQRWLPLTTSPRVSSVAPQFIGPGKACRVLCATRLEGYVLLPGHAVQVFYYGADGRIIRASDKVPLDDQVLARERVSNPKPQEIPPQEPLYPRILETIPSIDSLLQQTTPPGRQPSGRPSHPAP